MPHKHPLHLAIGFALVAFAAAPTARANPVPDPATASELDVIVVHSQVESQERAIDTKRASDAIEDVVSADAMGRYPDKNVAESLQRLPGVSVTRDQGEGRYVVVRGLGAGLNSVSVDGMAIGTPEDGARAAPLDIIPSESTERLRVIKAPTPDLPGDSIGGTILVESGSAFDRDGASLRGKLEGGYTPLGGDDSKKAAVNWSDIFADGRLGVMVGLNYHDREYQSDNIEAEYDEHDDLAPGELIPIEIQQRKYYVDRERAGVNLNLDWRQDEDNRYFLRTLFSDFADAETRQNSIIPLGEGSAESLGDGQYLIEGLDPGDFSRRVRWRTKAEDTFAISTGGKNDFGNSRIDYQVGYTRTRENVNDEVEARFEYDGSDDLGATLDTRYGVPRYTINDPSGDGWLRNDNYEFNRFVLAPKQVQDDALSAEFNFAFDAANGTEWKAGLLGRWRDRDVNVDEIELRAGPDLNLGQWTIGSPDYRHGNMGDGISSRAMLRYLRERLGEYGERPQDEAANTEISLIEDYVANEDVLSGYFMATHDFDNLRLIAGVRVEQTKFEATGNRVELADEETIESITTRTAENDYTNILPSIHLQYETGGDWMLRGALTRTIARPGFGDISPRTRIDRDAEEVELGNPALDPYESDNLDVSFEHYIGEAGIFSVGLFYKDIDGYIVNTVSRTNAEFPDYEVAMPVNGDKAEVRGLEMNWQQQFDFLPGHLDGLLAGVSGTWLDTTFNIDIDGRDDNEFALPQASDRIYSAYVGYEKFGLSTRVAAVYRNDYLEELGDNADYDIYVAPNTQLDFSLDYALTGNTTVYFEASNLLDEPLELYQGHRGRTLQMEEYGRAYTVGVKVNLW